MPSIITFAAALVAAWPTAAVAQTQGDDALLARGQYILRIAGCRHCHTTDEGELLAGGRALATPFGTFYTPNITPHKSAGIGAWSGEDFRRALHHGVAPDGSDYYPAFPYTSYARMRSDDVHALHAYLMSIPASPQPSREHDLPWYMRWRFAARVWKWLFFTPGEFRERPAQSAQWNRGAYLARALGHCEECHTTRNVLGALREDLAFAGNAHGPDDEKVPNITPDKDTGIGDWSRSDLYRFLEFGALPVDGEYASGSMEPVLNGLKYLTEDDRNALTDYLRALPPLDHRVRR